MTEHDAVLFVVPERPHARERVVRLNARLAPGEATPRRLSRSVGFVPTGPLGPGGGVRAVWLGVLGGLRRGRGVFGALLAGQRTGRCVPAPVSVAAPSKS